MNLPTTNTTPKESRHPIPTITRPARGPATGCFVTASAYGRAGAPSRKDFNRRGVLVLWRFYPDELHGIVVPESCRPGPTQGLFSLKVAIDKDLRERTLLRLVEDMLSIARNSSCAIRV